MEKYGRRYIIPIIVTKRKNVKGLTTAAGVWATAGVGMACGGQKYVLAVGATLILIFVQCIFHLNLGIFRSKKYYSVKIEFVHIIRCLHDNARTNSMLVRPMPQ